MLRISPSLSTVRAACALALVWVAAACVGSGALPLSNRGDPLTHEALAHTDAMYLWPERIDRRMLVGALDAFEQRFDGVRFEAAEQDTRGVLTVNGADARIQLDADASPEGYTAEFARYVEFVRAHLDEDLDPDETLELIALRGALGGLDRYTTVFAGRGTEDFRIKFSGKLSGIGSRIGRRDGQLVAVTVFPKSPAERGGLQDGDSIVEIDGEPTRPLTVGEAVDRIRGKAGTEVILGVSRGEGQEAHAISITRGEVSIPSVETKALSSGIGYARIFQFSAQTAREFYNKVRELGELEGLVLDLRGNTGGAMPAAVQIADLFLSDQLIVRVVDRNGEPKGGRSPYRATPNVAFRFPVVVLVDPSSASASEILSGAIRTLDRITVVGQTTFGKGLIQQVVGLGRRSTLKLTVAEYLLSNNRKIHEIGVVPDLQLEPVSSERLGALARVPDGALPYLRTPGEPDDFPIEVGEAILVRGYEPGIAVVGAKSEARIRDALAGFEIAWGDAEGVPEDLPERLVIDASSATLAAGTPGVLSVKVTNPNDFEIPRAWLAVNAPAEYLQNKIVPLGTIPANGTATGEIELVPPEGLSVLEHPIKLDVASGRRPLAAMETTLHVAAHVPELVISVERIEDAEIKVTIENDGPYPTGPLAISVPGAARSLDTVAAGALEEVTLSLTADPDEVSVVFVGPWVRQRIAVPIPEEWVRIVPPRLSVAHGAADAAGLLARLGDVFGDSLPHTAITIAAESPEGLGEAWIMLDGQKEAYADWNGSIAGQLAAAVEDGVESVTVKIETTSGVSIIDARRLRAD